jgi:hypothetical protein
MSDPPPGMKKPQAHHDLPEKFRDKFEAKGLDIDDPKNGRWVEGGPEGGHQKWSHEYNKEWEKFFDDHPNASKEEILEEVNKLRNDPRFQ